MKLPFRPPELLGEKNGLRRMWDQVSRLPGGTRLFDRIIFLSIPYTATVRPRVLKLGSGRAEVFIDDSRRVRNHLGSIHAVALANLAEYAGNLALAYSLPDGARFIVKQLSIEYLKKARGRIVAEGRCPELDTTDERDVEVSCELKNSAGEAVARATLTTLVGPVPARRKRAG